MYATEKTVDLQHLVGIKHILSLNMLLEEKS